MSRKAQRCTSKVTSEARRAGSRQSERVCANVLGAAEAKSSASDGEQDAGRHIIAELPPVPRRDEAQRVDHRRGSVKEDKSERVLAKGRRRAISDAERDGVGETREGVD